MFTATVFSPQLFSGQCAPSLKVLKEVLLTAEVKGNVTPRRWVRDSQRDK